jgi:hypothetical protein
MNLKTQDQDQETELSQKHKYFYVCTTGLVGGRQFFKDGLVDTDSRVSIITKECLMERRVLLNLIELTEEEYDQLIENMGYLQEEYESFREARRAFKYPGDEDSKDEDNEKEDKNRKKYPDLAGYS